MSSFNNTDSKQLLCLISRFESKTCQMIWNSVIANLCWKRFFGSTSKWYLWDKDRGGIRAKINLSYRMTLKLLISILERRRLMIQRRWLSYGINIKSCRNLKPIVEGSLRMQMSNRNSNSSISRHKNNIMNQRLSTKNNTRKWWSCIGSQN